MAELGRFTTSNRDEQQLRGSKVQKCNMFSKAPFGEALYIIYVGFLYNKMIKINTIFVFFFFTLPYKMARKVMVQVLGLIYMSLVKVKVTH